MNSNQEQQRFISYITTKADYNSFCDTEHFKDYHFYEKFNPFESYKTDLFECDYGKGMHTYLLKHYTVNLYKNVMGKGYEYRYSIEYVIAEENISKNELDILSQFCKCFKCNSSWFKWFDCKNYCNYNNQNECLKVNETIHAHQSSIDKARNAREKYFKDTNNIIF